MRIQPKKKKKIPIKREIGFNHLKLKPFFVFPRTYPNYSMKYNGCILVCELLHNSEKSVIILTLKIAL